MTAKAVAKYIRISPYKVRRIANELRNKRVIDAESYLTVLTNKGALAIKKVVHSARTNYLNMDKNADEETLVIKKINIDGGPSFKRFHPISRGRASRILKRTCHILVEVGTV
ncbi:MAG: 50S ribosomal protein L22 [Spirochaetes bacterium GWD1_27_9]|nr:MAG: 50S ribosomal protein L22 [Spirochaetes bacterium GWB1_27_13]OHD21025.1 MAG: 50S ribosomal protein L22 [Spirochaetes bacterium GWC1_27_15]OHD45386.1 MAG: 50S ribosomal protein L22 [Spirochaetes bacterium GWD1_27_9]